MATKNGYFSITLGDTSVQWTNLDFNQQYYIGTQIETDAEMTPRQAWCAAPYAMNVANGAVTTDKLADESVTWAKIKDGTVRYWELADGAVINSKIENGAVDQAKAPFAPKVNGGISNPKILCAHTVTDGSGNADITFSSTFNGAPVVLVARDWPNADPQFVNVQDVTSTGFHVNTYMWSAGLGMQKVGPIGFNWIAIGN